MQVFKAYFKIVRKHLLPLSIYVAVSLILFVMISGSLKSQSSAQFNETKCTIAIINNDGSSPLIDGLTDYLSTKADIAVLRDNESEIQDALFFGNVSYVLRVPMGFTQSFLSGKNNTALEKSISENSASNVSVDLYVNKYLNVAALYVNNVAGMSESEIARNVLSDLKVTSDTVYTSDLAQATTFNLSYYFRIIAYSILAIMISGITTIMMSFSRKDFSMRIQCSPLSSRKMNLQMVLANGVFAVIVWALSCAFIFITYGRFMLTGGIILLCLNALVFTIAGLGIGFLAGKFVKDHIVQSAVVNVVALGTSFICGVFVSQELLGKTVLKIASFTPGYWYIKAEEDIKNMSDFSSASISPIINSMLIQLGFAAVFILIALAATKSRRKQTTG